MLCILWLCLMAQHLWRLLMQGADLVATLQVRRSSSTCNACFEHVCKREREHVLFMMNKASCFVCRSCSSCCFSSLSFLCNFVLPTSIFPVRCFAPCTFCSSPPLNSSRLCSFALPLFSSSWFSDDEGHVPSCAWRDLCCVSRRGDRHADLTHLCQGGEPG